MNPTDFSLGVVTGLAPPILSWAAVRFWPVFINAVFKETRIAGEWKWFDCTSIVPVGTITIRQTGSLVRGKFLRSKSSDGHSTSRTFKFTGNIYGHTLILAYHEPDDPNTIRGSINLRVLSGRAVMYGKTMYFDGYKGKIQTMTFLLTKNEELSNAEVNYLKGIDAQQAIPRNGDLPIDSQLDHVHSQTVPQSDTTI